MVCKNCDKEIQDDFKMCPYCGELKGKTTEAAVNEEKIEEENVESVVSGETKMCDWCFCKIPAEAKICPTCNKSVPVNGEMACERCKGIISVDAEVCPHCGMTTLKGRKAKHNEEQTFREIANTISPKAAVTAEKKKTNTTLIVLLAILGVIVVGFILFKAEVFVNKKDFNRMYGSIANETWCEIAADGSWMKIDTNPYDIDDKMELVAYDKVEEINQKLGFTSALFKKIGESSALDGKQSDKNNDVTVSWTYHPNKGLEVFYEWNN